MTYRTHRQAILAERRRDPIGMAFHTALAFMRISHPRGQLYALWQAEAIAWASGHPAQR